MKSQVLADLGPLYHSYRLFGVDNEQLPGIYEPNQRCKEPIILGYVHWAIGKCRTHLDTPVSFAELFCADAYYAMAASFFGATSSIGIDDNRHNQSNEAPQIIERLGFKNVRLIDLDVQNIDQLEPVDIVANVGGLYHVSNPAEILTKSYQMANRYLIVQNVVSLARSEPDYFESPAPGLTWGSRYSRQGFERLLRQTGYKIIDMHFNELEGNDRLEDRGSVYALIEKTQSEPIRQRAQRFFGSLRLSLRP
ncbi:hypothetical protein [Microvirga splendida]|uniref:Methyltransferase domain-containing protein n=1 Tax=Microvirga splendida TaxID=2795727 RepID=A0ABS0Y6C4_9HYPH|nr:hypothetical protein [Microvirga splendida]MBJ6127846.1 hypothetical protein [Microvirga splendida]